MHLLPHRPIHIHIPFFRIFYSTTFTLLCLLLTALLLITPGDNIFQSFRAHQIYHIIIVAGAYLLTFTIAVFIYAGRLYGTRSALAGIPRELNLNDNASGKGGGLGLGAKERVARMVREGLDRSALIAYEAHPRDLRDEKAKRHIRRRSKRRDRTSKDSSILDAGTSEPVWGTISHPGWSSPSSPDLPNLHYEAVILELANLIEAKAVSLAPPDPLYNPQSNANNTTNNNNEEPLPDPLAVSLLQRPPAMSLREYLSHLTHLSMLPTPHQTTTFLSAYEHARFSETPLHDPAFRKLMSTFADLLTGMLPPPASVISTLHASPPPSEREPNNPRRSPSLSSTATVEHTPRLPSSSSVSSASSEASGTAHTAPSRPRTVHPVSETSSLAPWRSNTSSNPRSAAGSVIRLAEGRGPLDLPYTFHHQ